jgi:hypothetical protein
MTTNRPFTLLAAVIFAAMALVHAYRLMTHFQIILGSHEIPLAASWIAIAITGLMAVLLYRESQR